MRRAQATGPGTDGGRWQALHWVGVGMYQSTLSRPEEGEEGLGWGCAECIGCVVLS